MNKKTIYLSYIFAFLFVLIGMESLYFINHNSMSKEMRDKKNIFVSLVGLPDLAISTEATYVRHRTMATVFSIYKDDGTLREYFPSTYAISHSHITNPHAKIKHEK